MYTCDIRGVQPRDTNNWIVVAEHMVRRAGPDSEVHPFRPLAFSLPVLT